MFNRKKPDREQQIALMVGAAARTDGYIAKWQADPEVKESLHRHDRPPAHPIKRVASR